MKDKYKVKQRPNSPAGEVRRGMGASTSTTPQTKSMKSRGGKSVSVRVRSRKDA